MFALLDYNAAAAGVNTVNLDFSAVSDPDFSQRNGHYIFTESYRLWGSCSVGASLTRGRYQVPTWNAIGEFSISQPNRALVPTSNPQFDLWAVAPPRIPINEEFQVQYSNNLGAATEQENVGVWLLTDDWTPTLPTGVLSFQTRATFTVTPTINVWSGPQTLTFSQSLRGGVYSVIGCQVQGTNSVFFRLIFPRYQLYSGRKLRPGSCVQTAIGDIQNNQWVPWQFALGEWGRFHTFEPVQIEVLGATAAGTTYQVFLYLVYLGQDVSLLGYGARSI